MQGWFKVHRKLLVSDIFKNEKLFKIFMYCLMKSTHTPFEQRVGRQIVPLKEGQFVFGRKIAALELDMKESTVWSYMNILKDDKIINIESNNRYSVISVVNWAFYQEKDEKNNSKDDNKGTTNGQQMDTNKNVKNVKNDKKNNKRYSRKQVYDENSNYYQLAIFFYKQIKNNNPEHKKPNLQTWSDDIRKMIELDKRTDEQVKYLMQWVQQDDFEMANVLSPAKLRKRFDSLVIKVKRNKPSNVTPITQAKNKKYNYGF